MKKITLIIAAIVWLTVFINLSLKAQLLVEENFNFTGLLSDNGWTAHSGAGTLSPHTVSGALTWVDYASSGIGNSAVIDTTGEDVSRNFTEQTSGSIYVSFLVNIEKAKVVGDYFLHIGRTSMGTTFCGRVYAKYDDVTGKIAFGLSKSSNTPAYTGFDYDFNTTYLLVMKYSMFSGVSDTTYLFINPAVDDTEPIADLIDYSGTNDLTNMGTIALRQGNLSNAPKLIIDGIRIGREWTDIFPEPVNSGIFETRVTTNSGGANTYDISNDFNGSDFGDIPSNATFYLVGGQVKTWKNDPPDDIIGARMMYRIYEQTAVAPDFDTIVLPWRANLTPPTDQLWENDTMGINILNGLANGDYNIEVYFQADYTVVGTPGIITHTDNNSDNNFIATFSITDPAPNSGIFETRVTTNDGTGNSYNVSTDFDGLNFGLLLADSELHLKGGQVKTWKNDPPDDIIGARMMYRVYEQSTTAPQFDTIELPWRQNLMPVTDQLWENDTMNIDLLDGLADGNYFIEVFFEADYLITGDVTVHTHRDDNSGDNYIAHFSYLDITCNADTVPFAEGFNNTNMPACWTQVQEGGTTLNWTFVTSGNLLPAAPYEGSHFAYLSSATTADDKVKLVTNEIDLSTAVLPYLKFHHYMAAWGADQDELSVFYRTAPVEPWILLETYTSSVTSWTERTIQLPNGTATYQIAFKGNAKRGRGIAIDNVIIDKPLANDVAVIEWVSPLSGCGMTATEPITIKITNLGSMPQSNIPVIATIDAGTTILGPEIIAGPIQPGDTINYTFVNSTANMTNPGLFICAAVLMLSTDENKDNDTIIEFVYSLPHIATFPYSENFDNIGDWSPGVINGVQQWELGLPAQTQLNNTFSGINQNAWMTKLTTNYDNNVDVFLQSPCFDFTALAMPMFSVWLNIKTEENLDAMIFESSVDGGLTWDKVIGDAGFYNNTSAAGTVAPPKWSGSNNGWTKYETSLPDLAGEDDVKLRFRFISNGSVVDEGVAVDEIYIYEQNATDVGLTVFISPENSVCGFINDSIRVTVRNYGHLEQDTIPVIVEIIKPDNTTETVIDTLFTNLMYGQSGNLTVGAINTQMSGVYTVVAYTALVGDLNHVNDTIYTSFTVAMPLSIPYVQDFEIGLQDWLTDMTIGSNHGNTSAVLYQLMDATTTTAFGQSPKVGLVSVNDYLTFDYRIVDYSLAGPWDAATLAAGDTILVLITNDCGETYQIIDTIYDANHTPSTMMQNMAYDISSFAGDEIFVRFEIQRALAGEYYFDLDNVIIASIPHVDLGADTITLCEGFDITLDAENATPYTSYEWFTLSAPTVIATTQTITVDSSATYVVVVDNGFGITATDTITLIMLPIPVVDLGDDLLICSTDTITLDAGVETSIVIDEGLRGVLPIGWTSFNDGPQPIEHTSAGGYLLLDHQDDWVITEAYDLTGLPHVELWVDIAAYGAGENNLMIVDVSVNNGLTWNTTQFPAVTDTTLTTSYITQGPYLIPVLSDEMKFRFRRPSNTGKGVRFRDFKITSSTPFVGYNWSTGATTQTIDISNAGTYWVVVTGANGCHASDTINVAFFSVPVIDFGSDTAICVGDVLVLDAGPNFETYEWHDGSTLQTFNVTDAGTFWVFAVDANGCTNTDTISVIINPLPVADLGADTSICLNTSIILDAGAGINYSYEWKEVGQTTVLGTAQTLTVSNAGHYYVIVDNGCAATATDTILVSTLPVPSVDLGQDKEICYMTSTVLDAGTQDNYLWNTGATTPTITVDTAGSYWVVVTNTHGCSDSDTINIIVHPLPNVNLGNDTTICIFDNILLNAGYGFVNYLWNDSSTAQNLFIQGSVYGIGVYTIYVTVEDNNGCHASDTVIVTVDACTGIEMLDNSVNIYPNPTQDKLFIEFDQNWGNTADLFIYNINGRLVHNERLLNTSENSVTIIDLRKHAKGMYFLTLKNDEKTLTFRVVYN